MGRGLSELQKTLLELAYHNRLAGLGSKGSTGADMYY
jgi:hypothetical protein